ncbi:MAG TPA: hypothetical protein VK165_01960 [Azonexus sp.]|nr:hypothetical protein [Azonexus sp.]
MIRNLFDVSHLLRKLASIPAMLHGHLAKTDRQTGAENLLKPEIQEAIAEAMKAASRAQ